MYSYKGGIKDANEHCNSIMTQVTNSKRGSKAVSPIRGGVNQNRKDTSLNSKLQQTNAYYAKVSGGLRNDGDNSFGAGF